MVFEKKIFFNSSLPRSGSTLLQNILAQNPRFYCSATSGLFDLLHASRHVFTEGAEFKAQDRALVREAFRKYCEYGINGFYEGLTDKPVCVEKGRAWLAYYDWLKTFHPEPKILVCIRDLRAILSSFEKLYRKNRDLHDPQDDVHRMNMMTLDRRMVSWLNGVPLGTAYSRLVDTIQTGLYRKFCFVRFEDLTSDPDVVFRRVYTYLGEDYFEHDFENIKQMTHENDQLHGIYGDHIIRGKIAPVPLDYQEVLGKEMANTVKLNNPLFFSKFYPAF